MAKKISLPCEWVASPWFFIQTSFFVRTGWKLSGSESILCMFYISPGPYNWKWGKNQSESTLIFRSNTWSFLNSTDFWKIETELINNHSKRELFTWFNLEVFFLFKIEILDLKTYTKLSYFKSISNRTILIRSIRGPRFSIFILPVMNL